MISHDLGDFEPLDARERCDQAYGFHHIGRDDESRDELALFFDVGWLPYPDFLEDELWSLINEIGGRVRAYSVFASPDHSAEQLQALLTRNLNRARPIVANERSPSSIAIVELARPSIFAVDTMLRAYSAYLGYADISWPSDLRSIITAQQCRHGPIEVDPE